MWKSLIGSIMPSSNQNRKTCLTIAGSDPSGGAGVQADLKTFEAIGVRGISAVTAVTAQTSRRFLSSHPVPADILTQQLSAISEEAEVAAIKIGMIATAANVQTIAWFLKRMEGVPVVLDPVFDSSSGGTLLEKDALPIFEQHLLPLATVVTPNLAEASTLARMWVGDVDTMHAAARGIHENIRCLRGDGQKGLVVIVKGGHLKSGLVDVVYSGEGFTSIGGEVLHASMHGSGCVYSAALAAYLALGLDIIEAARKAKEFTTQEMKRRNRYDIVSGK